MNKEYKVNNSSELRINKKATNNPQSKKDLLDSLNDFCSNYKNKFLYVGLGLAILLSLLLFNPQIYESGDDTAYIERAYHFIKDGIFPSFQGPLYPIVLGIFIKILGIQVILLKFLSLLFGILALYLFFKAFENKVSNFILCITFILLCINSNLLFYNSQTLSEAFFMCIQALFLYLFIQKIEIRETIEIKKQWKLLLLFGIVLLCLVTSKNIAYASIFAIALYCTIKKRWKLLIYLIVSFILVFVIYSILKNLFFVNSGSSVTAMEQIKLFLAKDYYNPQGEQETIMGFISRFFENLNNYFNNIFEFLNIISNTETESSHIPSILLCSFLGIALYNNIKKQNDILFVIIYVLSMCGITFIILQSYWQQSRVILVYFSIILIIVLSTFYHIFKTIFLQKFQWLFVISIGILFILTLQKTINKTQQNNDVLIEAINGNPFSSYTSDWYNYLKVSQWAAENTPNNTKIACRKSSMSFIISGQDKFYGIYNIPTISLDDFLNDIDTVKQILYIIPYKQMPAFLQSYILSIIVNAKGETFFLCNIPSTIQQQVDKEMQLIHFSYIKNFSTWYQQNPNIVFYSPDQLMNTLKKNNVEYVLLANLLRNPNDLNDNNIINTVHRYMYYIAFKYPDFLSAMPLYSLGNERDAAIIIKLTYPN